MAIEQCRAVVEKPDTDTAVSAYLAGYVNIRMCAEIESVVTRLIRERIEQGCDEPVANFLKSMRRSTIRNATYGEIANALGLFGATYKSAFEKAVEENHTVGEEGIEMLGLAVGKRNETAHTQAQPNITFGEVETAFEVAVEIVSIAQDILQE